LKAAALILALLVAGAAHAQGVSAATTHEIAQLFAALRQSNCQFLRNGTWYDARQAGDHLQRKYEYLLDKGMLTTTESFIDLAATKSSISGKPYQVRCGAAAPEPSRAWFLARLQTLRRPAPQAEPTR
jgi:hypothetical protein